MVSSYRNSILPAFIGLLTVAILVSSGGASSASAVVSMPSRIASLPLAVAPGDLPSDLCSPNDNDDVSLLRSMRCIAEDPRRTRGYVKPTCIRDLNNKALRQAAEYTNVECRSGSGIYAETVAQARAIAQLNNQSVYGDTSNLGVTPNLQWEVRLPVAPGDPNPRAVGGRPDLWLYDRTNPTGSVGIVELKLSESAGGTGLVGARQSLDSYLAALPGTRSKRDVVRHAFVEPFIDVFQIVRQCENAPVGVQERRLYQTRSLGSDPGILIVDLVDHQKCPTREELRQKAEQEGQIEVPIIGELGADRNGNAVDDLVDSIIERAKSFDCDSCIPAPFRKNDDGNDGNGREVEAPERIFAPLPQPVSVEIDRDTAVVILGVLATGVTLGVVLSVMQQLAPRLAAAAIVGTAGTAAVPFVLAVAIIALVAALVIPAVMDYSIWGDPHLGTLDRLHYDLQSVGEFHLLQVPDTEIDVQARFSPVPNSRTTSTVSSAAFKLNDSLVEVRWDGSLVIDDVVRSPDEKYFDFGSGATLLRDGTRLLATLSSEVTLVLWQRAPRAGGGIWNVAAHVSEGVTTRGLLGNNDGVAENDLVTAQGETVSASAAAVLHGRYADSWRIGAEESLFSYGDDESTESFTDSTFPDQILTLADFPANEVALAADVCRAEGVAEGPQFDDCTLDVLITGDDTYATAAASVTDFLVEPSASTVDGSGKLNEDFEGAISPNVRPIRTRTLTTGQAAGPLLDSGGYTFSVPGLPSHDALSIAFDVYVFGLSDPQGQSAIVTLKPEGMPLSAFSFSQGSAVSSGQCIT